MKLVKGSGTQFTEHFNQDEFDCKCKSCSETLFSTRLFELLEQLRDIYNRPIQINSGYRCKSHNKKVGGASNSQHIHGTAADIVLPGQPVFWEWELFITAVKLGFGGVGLYKGRIHVDVRSNHTYNPTVWIDRSARELVMRKIS